MTKENILTTKKTPVFIKLTITITFVVLIPIFIKLPFNFSTVYSKN